MLRTPSRSLAILLGTLPMAALHAADKTTEEMVVTASRVEKPLSTIPNTVTVIKQDDLERQLAIHNDISTVLGNMIPSFAPSRQKMTNAGESLRGRKPLYMIDGVPQSSPLRDGGRDGHTIDSSVIARVEVLHGANAIHGMGASGGVINLITKKPSNKLEQNIRVETTFQTEDIGESADYGVSYNISNRIGAADFLAAIAWRDNGVAYDADGHVIGADNTQGDTADSRTLNTFLKTGYDLTDTQRLELTYNRYDIKGKNNWVSVPGNVATGVPSGARKGSIPGKGARNEATTLSLNFTDDDVFGHALRAQIFTQDLESTYGAEAVLPATFVDPAYGPNLVDQSQNNSEKKGIKITLAKDDIAQLGLNVVYGFDAVRDETWQRLIQTGRTWVPKSRNDNIAPFLQLEYVGIDALTITAGVRHEKSKLKVDDFTTLRSANSSFVRGGEPEFSETLYNVGATYRFADDWRVFANYSEAFSMPDVGRVLRAINIPNQSVDTFLDLKPILTENTEVGVEFNNQVIDAQLTWYSSDSDFGQRLNRGSDGIYTVSRERTEIDGIELRSNWHITDADTLGLRYSHTKGRYDANQDNKVDSDLGGANIAPDRINLSWDRQWSDAVRSRIQVNHLLDRDFENASGATINEFDGYTTVDASTDIAAFGGTVTVAVQNLTNADYFTYYSQTSPLNERYFKGLGRSFSVGYQRSF